jgi:hypothetical protein
VFNVFGCSVGRAATSIPDVFQIERVACNDNRLSAINGIPSYDRMTI